MINPKIVPQTIHLLLNTPTTALTPSNPGKEVEKVVLECPRCCWIFEVKSPDSYNLACDFNRPEVNETVVVEEPRVCRNPKCKKHFSLYWHKPTTRANTSSFFYFSI